MLCAGQPIAVCTLTSGDCQWARLSCNNTPVPMLTLSFQPQNLISTLAPSPSPASRCITNMPASTWPTTTSADWGLDSSFQSLHQPPGSDAGAAVNGAAPLMTRPNGAVSGEVRHTMSDGMRYSLSTSALDSGAMSGLSEDFLYSNFGDFDMVFAEPHNRFVPGS